MFTVDLEVGWSAVLLPIGVVAAASSICELDFVSFGVCRGRCSASPTLDQWLWFAANLADTLNATTDVFSGPCV